MADFNVTGNSPTFSINPNSKKFKTDTTHISFQAAQACQINFSPATGNCFGVASITLAGGNDKMDQLVTNPSTLTTTTGTAVAQQMSAAAGAGADGRYSVTADGVDSLQITFGDTV